MCLNFLENLQEDGNLGWTTSPAAATAADA